MSGRNKSGRRQFLKSVAATASFATSACSEQSGENNTPPLASEAAGQATSDGSSQVATSTGDTNVAVSNSTQTATTTAGNETTTGSAASNATAQSSDLTSDTPSNAATGSTDTVVSSPDTNTSGATDITSAPRLTSPLGVALLGLGKYAGERLAPALQLTQHCRLVGIITGTPSKVAEWQTTYAIADKNVYSYETMDAILDNPDIHVVYVVTPNHLHPEFVARAARAKKHVWCEKPMAMTPEECQGMIDVCKENGVSLSIGYRLQHEPNTKTVIGYADSKPLGAITQIDALAGFSGFSAAEADVWRLKKAPGGGALFDMGVYCINAARYASGEEPSRVRSAKQWTDRPELFTEVDEFTDFELEFPSGAVALCRTSFGERMDSLAITCAQGSYKLEPFQGYTGVSGSASDGTQFNQTIENQQAKQMDDDALALIEGRAALVPGEEGIRDVRIIQAIVQAAQTGQPVDLA